MKYRYDAFISYSRKDEAVAQLLQKKLEHKFSDLHPKYRVKKQRVMVALDSEDLEASEDLSDEIKKKIGESKHLIVLNSKSSNKSEWVKKEITFFKESRKKDNKRKIITLLLDLPEELSIGDFPTELIENNKVPLALDLRPSSISKSRSSFKKYYEQNIILQIYSTFLNVKYSDLINRHEKHRRQVRYRRITTALTIIIVLLSIFVIALIQGIKPNFKISNEIDNPLPEQTFSPAIVLKNDKSIIKGTDNGSIYFIDSNGSLRDSLNLLTGLVIELELYHDSILLGSSLESDFLIIWNTIENKLIRKISNPDTIPFTSFAYSPKTNTVVIGDNEGTLFIERDREILSYKSDDEGWGRIQDIKFFANEEKILYCFLDGPVGIVDLKQDKNTAIETFSNPNIETVHSIEEVNGSIFLCAWGTSFSTNVFLKLSSENNLIQIRNSTSTLDEIHRINNTDKILTFDWDGNIRLFEDEKELTNISISDKVHYIENNAFTIDYNDEINTVCAFTNNKIYFIEIEWRTIFGIKSTYLKYL